MRTSRMIVAASVFLFLAPTAAVAAWRHESKAVLERPAGSLPYPQPTAGEMTVRGELGQIEAIDALSLFLQTRERFKQQGAKTVVISQVVIDFEKSIIELGIVGWREEGVVADLRPEGLIGSAFNLAAAIQSVATAQELVCRCKIGFRLYSLDMNFRKGEVKLSYRIDMGKLFFPVFPF